MFDHDQGVTQRLQSQQGFDESMIIALVQPDRGLIQHVEHPHQARADLSGKSNSLRLPTGKAASRASEREVIQADVEQEPDPFLDLLYQPLSDLGLPLV